MQLQVLEEMAVQGCSHPLQAPQLREAVAVAVVKEVAVGQQVLAALVVAVMENKITWVCQTGALILAAAAAVQAVKLKIVLEQQAAPA